MWPRPLERCLIPLSWIYGTVVRLRAALYRIGLLPTRTLPCPVISVGNLTVGGTGKTPVTIFVVTRLLAQGCRVGVLSRGYRRASTDEMALVSDGKRVLLDPFQGGDEPVLIARRCPQAVVAVGADRFRLGQWVLQQFPLDVLVLDDGYQHLGLGRTHDLLLVDAGAPESLRRMLPAGSLREPLAAAARASAFLITRSEDDRSGDAALERLQQAEVPPRPTVRLRFSLEAVTDLHGDPSGTLADLAGRRAIMVCGIARPASFQCDLERLGVQVVGSCVWPDHHAYSSGDLDRIKAAVAANRAEVILMTEKDAGKVALVATEPDLRATCRVLRMGVEILEGQDELDRLLASCRVGAEQRDPASPIRVPSLY